MTEYYRVPNFNSKCNSCKLTTGYAVTGQSEVPLKEVRLIVISAYPGRNEVKENISLASKETEVSCSAGAFLRKCIKSTFNNNSVPEHLRDFYKYIYATNAIKCEKGSNNVSETHIKLCFQSWLKNEIEYLPSTVPILIAAGEAVKALFPKEGGLYKNRRRPLMYNRHPCIVTMNPIEWERNHMRITVEKTVNKVGVSIPVTTVMWKPAPVGSIMWHVKKDLEDIKRLVLDYDNAIR
jgi:uracil-DNA glycosylase